VSEPPSRRIDPYPGSLTYLDLIRRNRRDSTLLMAGVILLAMALGAVIAGALALYSGLDPQNLLVPVLLGASTAFAAGSMTAAWSWYGGANAILALSGARPLLKEEDPELFNVVEELAIAGGLPMPRVYLIPESALNAFATGRDPEHAVVAITTGLREKLSRDELQGVMAHEMSHVRYYDTRFALLMATEVGLIVFAADAFRRIVFYGGRAGRRGGRGKGGGGAAAILILIAVVLGILAPLIARLMQMAYSRRREYLADAGGVELTRNPDGLISALGKLAADTEPLVEKANRGTAHMFIVNPLRRMRASGQTLDTFLSSHPPIQERIARLRALTR